MASKTPTSSGRGRGSYNNSHSSNNRDGRFNSNRGEFAGRGRGQRNFNGDSC
ncbi:hypothetical protein CsatB_012101 [Cannabis sativa]